MMVDQGRFRDDLYFRLNVFPVELPPLRERLEDLPLLAEHFLRVYAEKNQRRVRTLAPEVLEAFRRHPWPGNIRELENIIERGVIVCRGDTLRLEDLPGGLQHLGPGDPFPEEGEPQLADLERQLISRTLEKVAGQRRQAAEILGISMDELNLKMRSYGLEE
jgi:two-component system, NtrC family, response regulator HydG